MNEIMTAAFFKELENIQKEAGLGSFLIKGIKGLGGVGKTVKELGVRGALKQHGKGVKGAWKRGVSPVGAEGPKRGGWWEGAKEVARTPEAAMAGTAGLGGLAAYGAGKAVLGD